MLVVILDDDEVEPVELVLVVLQLIDETVELELFSNTIQVVRLASVLLDDDEVEPVFLDVVELEHIDDELVDIVVVVDEMQAIIDDDEVERLDNEPIDVLQNDETDINELYLFLIVALVRLIFNDEIVVSLVAHIKSTDSQQIENFVFYKEDRLFCAVFLLKILNYDVFEYIQKCFIL